MIQEHERSVSAMPLEWMVIPEAFVMLSGSFEHAIPMLEGLQVNQDQMLDNLSLGGGLLMAEAVMMGLASKIGRNKAHDIIAKTSRRAWDEKITLREALIDDESTAAYFSPIEIDSLIDPINYIGCSAGMITRVVRKVNNE